MAGKYGASCASARFCQAPEGGQFAAVEGDYWRQPRRRVEGDDIIARDFPEASRAIVVQRAHAAIRPDDIFRRQGHAENTD